MKNRIKELRESRGLIQEILATELGVTQQTLSRYERDITCCKIDVLIKIARYFNVTSDYLLGISEIKRDLQGQIQMNKVLDTYYDLVDTYIGMDMYDKELILSIVQNIKKISIKRNNSNICKEKE